MAKPRTGFPLLTYLDKLVNELREHAPRALGEWDSEAIHDARVATRRLKAALDLMDPVLSKEHRKPFAKILKKLRRRLGPLRDADVMLGHIHELESKAGSDAAVRWLRAHLEQQRERARARSQKQGGADEVLAKLDAWTPVRQEVAEAAEAVDSLLSESLHLQLDAFAERAGRLVAPQADGSQRQDPHQLRIAGKLLRYTLEMAEKQGHKVPGGVLRGFKQMQESLGLWHDYVVLTESAMEASLDRLLPHHDAELQADVLDLSRLFLRRASKELEQFSKRWQSKGEELARVVRQTFPLTRPLPQPQPLSASQTGPGPSDSTDTPAPEAPAPDAASPA